MYDLRYETFFSRSLGKERDDFQSRRSRAPNVLLVSPNSSRAAWAASEITRGKLLAMKVYSDIVTKRMSSFDQPLIYRKGVWKMKRPVLFILVLSVLIIPTKEVHAQRAVVLSNTLNVRSGPGMKFEVVDKLNKGDSYLIDRIEGDWVQLAWPVEAWVYKKLVRIEESRASFEQLQIDFQNWLLDKYYRVRSVEFKSEWQIWLKLREYPSRKTLQDMAKNIALEYKKQTGFSKRPVVVTIFWKNRAYVKGQY